MNDLTKQQNHSTSCANFDLEILNFQNLSTTCANFDLEILNFQNLICPFGLKHGVYTAATLKDFRIDEMGTNGGIGGGIGEVALINVTKTEYQYKYNGKEYQDELGLNMYAMDMRQYDPAIARWVVQDPVTHFDFSPYNAFDNNPVFWADPSGADAVNIGYDRVVDTNSFSGSATWSGGFREISGERKNDEVSANQNSSSNSNANSAQNLDNGEPSSLKGGEFDRQNFDDIKEKHSSYYSLTKKVLTNKEWLNYVEANEKHMDNTGNTMIGIGGFFGGKKMVTYKESQLNIKR